uniref:Vesicle transport protein n=1 Tax=Rhizochromulina marina TaxID=1034831 RepID=A0A7S2WV25_9STRA
MISDGQKIGALLCLLGMCFFSFGVVWFLDRSLLTIGNILFLTGMALCKGPSATVQFFSTRMKSFGVPGVLFFFSGILLVLFKWTFIGIVLESFGFLNLFGSFFPFVVDFARRLPVVGQVLSMPWIAGILDRITGATQRSQHWA